jgi:hypothetical protein
MERVLVVRVNDSPAYLEIVKQALLLQSEIRISNINEVFKASNIQGLFIRRRPTAVTVSYDITLCMANPGEVYYHCTMNNIEEEIKILFGNENTL